MDFSVGNFFASLGALLTRWGYCTLQLMVIIDASLVALELVLGIILANFFFEDVRANLVERMEHPSRVDGLDNLGEIGVPIPIRLQ